MRRLPACGTAVVFLATLAVSAVAVADPIKIETAARGGERDVRLTPLGTPGGFYFSGSRASSSRSDMDAVELTDGWGGSSRGNQAFVGGSRGGFGGAVGNPWGGGLPAVSGGFVAPKSASVVPFDVPTNLTGDSGPAPQPAGSPMLPQPLPASGTVQLPLLPVNPVSSGSVLLPSAAASGSSNAVTVGSAASVVTPEPASMLLLGSGLAFAGLGARMRRRRK